ncbi:hypothetical protein ALC56_04173 [Trachymyrmex septentrionalis]|uniref:GIY-YIG domain-containing protein n=1 Tax=Trachymyrmex septentrionalis TaxID=34720 RepID=A0A151JYG3_9HYME|nr:hypothetical protein ALC56_04173 [Trachymyrmex septentrionalis]
MAYRGINKLNRFIKVQKVLSRSSQSNVVYKIDCKDCDASYVGQTSRCLKTRITEHKNHINRNTTQHSVITQYRIDLGYDFNWDKVHILDKEQILHKRLLSEMIHIKRQK